MIGPTHYRIVDTLEPNGVVIRVRLFEVMKETPAGYWVVESLYSRYGVEYLKHYKLLRWVSKTSTKRHCYPELADALRSFKRRKEVQVSKLRLQFEQSEKALSEFGKYQTANVDQFKKGVDVGTIPSLAGLVWDW